ncbi:MAG: YkgJ family cysteine cluster protein [Treponema sp.]|jgi:Fe-S-cluster containining protein|nr:YkgJ family cysteine cluster protein [Treponema sp.]
MNNQPFHAAGLLFSCTRCSSCCRHESGFVYLSEPDLSRLANEFKMEYTAFIKTWCRWVSFSGDSERLALKEKSNFDCIFWKDAGDIVGCTVYQARPLQCRVFPFWDNVVCSPEAWETAGRACPGINTGELHSREKIENFLRLMGEELIIERKVSLSGGGV